MKTFGRTEAMARVNSWTEELRWVLGARFRAVIVYGSAARDDFDPVHSDVNLLVVVARADLDTLRDLMEPLQKARVRFRGAPFVMTQEEILNSRDVFPIKFHEMARAYQVVAGEDVLANLHLSFQDLRHAAETELRNIAMKLRRVYLAEGPDPRPLLLSLRHFSPQILGVLRVFLDREALGGLPEDADLAALGGARFGFDPEDLRQTLQLRREEHVPWPLAEQAFGRLLNVLERLAEGVDAWAPE